MALGAALGEQVQLATKLRVLPALQYWAEVLDYRFDMELERVSLKILAASEV